MRYVKQPDLYSCGPTAILNCLRWAGEPVSVKGFLPFLQFGCRTIDLEEPTDYDSNGTTNTDFDRVLRYVGRGLLKVRKVKHISLATIRKHAAKGGIVALGYHWEDGAQSGDHFCVIVGYEAGHFIVVNDHMPKERRAKNRRNDETVSRWIKKRGNDPVGWLISLD